ncbi:MAG: flavodoxin family protein [Candidatus Lokiarchaeota archaeon]
MKVTLIVGSPRKHRSCNFLIENTIKGIKSVSEEIEISKLQISDYNITPCNGCDNCLREPYTCPLSESEIDDLKKIEQELFSSDAVLIASPSYFGSVSAYLKLMIDRSRPWKMNNYSLSDKFFAPLIAQGTRNDAAGGVIYDLINFAIIQGMIVVGALGNPVLEQNIPVTSLQKYGRKEFLRKDEVDELGAKISENLGIRVANLIMKSKK